MIERSPSTRVHVPAHEWAVMPGTDFWIFANIDSSAVASATNPGGLDGWGWLQNSVVFTNTLTADFLSAADDTPPNYSANASADVFRSPLIFGSYAHGLYAKQILGYQPTKLCVEFYGAFLTASADEVATHMGFQTSSGLVVGIYSDATNLLLSNGTTEDAGIAVDNAYHLFRIEVDATNSTWYVDGTSQGSIATPADLWPAGFGFTASTTNRPAFAWAHVWYE